MSASAYRFARDVAWQVVGDRVVIVDLDKGRALGLNESASAVWPLLEDRSLDEIVDSLRSRFDVAPEAAREGVSRLVGDLVARGLLVEAG